MTILSPADVRQENHWECGAAASMSAASLFDVGPATLAEWVKLLGTSEAKSTSPAAIVQAFTDLGLDVQAREKMTLADLAAAVAAGRAVICCCQDYTGIRSQNAAWDYGHWVVVIGVIGQYVVLQDSSIENALGVPGGDVPKDEETDMGNLAAPGRVLVYRDKSALPPDQPDALTWMENWHDVDEDGTEFVQYGIALCKPIEPPKPTAEEETSNMSVNPSLKSGTRLLRVPFTARGLKVDREKQIIYGMPLAQAGPFKSEGRGEFDLQSLTTILTLAQAAPRGLKARLAHPDESHDGIDKTLGRWEDPVLGSVADRDAEGTLKTDTVPAVLADLHFNPAASKGPFDMADYVMTLAETDSALFSTSLVLQSEREFRLNQDGTPVEDAEGNRLPPLWRPTALMACDVVSTGDACDGVLAASGGSLENLSHLPNGLAFLAAAALDKHFQGKPAEFIAAHALRYLLRYLRRRNGEVPALAAILSAFLDARDQPDDSEAGDTRDGGPNAGDHADDIPEGSGEPQELHDGCRSTHGLHRLTLCRLCGAKMAPSCACDNVAKESRVVVMNHEPCAKCKLAAGEDNGQGGGATVPAGAKDQPEADVEQARKQIAAALG